MAAAIARHDARKRARRIRSAVAFLILSALLTGYGVAFFYRITS